MSHEQTTAEHECGAHAAEVQAAEERVRQAREELRLAEEQAAELHLQTEGEPAPSRTTTIGVVVDDVLKIVKKYPMPSIVTAAAIGFFLGRLFRR